jgi:hypothetical protein
VELVLSAFIIILRINSDSDYLANRNPFVMVTVFFEVGTSVLSATPLGLA